MSKEKLKSVKKESDKAGAISSSKPIEEITKGKKIRIDFDKFYLSVQLGTLDNLEEFVKATQVSLREAIGFFVDLGSMMYVGMKQDTEKKIQEMKDLKEKSGKEENSNG